MNSLHLLRQLVEEIRLARDSDRPCTRLFFTKESKVMCLLNIVLLCGLRCRVTPVQIQELDCMFANADDFVDLTQITFELYERKGSANESREYSLRIEFSPGRLNPLFNVIGAHDSNLIDLELDSKHALSVAPRFFISDHIPLGDALSYLSPKNVALVNLAPLKSIGSESEEGLFHMMTPDASKSL